MGVSWRVEAEKASMAGRPTELGATVVDRVGAATFQPLVAYKRA